jgi:hypothetical protein
MARAALPCPLETLLHSRSALMTFSRFKNITSRVEATPGPQWRAANLTVSCSSGVRWGQSRSKFGMTWTRSPNRHYWNGSFSVREVLASSRDRPAPQHLARSKTGATRRRQVFRGVGRAPKERSTRGDSFPAAIGATIDFANTSSEVPYFAIRRTASPRARERQTQGLGRREAWHRLPRLRRLSW